MTKDAIDFISKLLIKDPDERMFAEDALKHDFIVKNFEKDDQKLRGRNKWISLWIHSDDIYSIFSFYHLWCKI